MTWKIRAGLTCLLALVAVPAACGMMIAPPAIGQRVAMADCTILGKVISLEPKTVLAPRFPGDKEKGEYTIAIVKIDQALSGVRGMTSLRVGFLTPKPPPVVAPVPGAGPRIIVSSGGRRIPPVTLTVDQEACFFLTKHATEPFYVIPAYYDIMNKKGDPNFVKQLEPVKKAAHLLADPRAGFASKDASERFLTAALLLTRYQTNKPGAKLQPISAEESKAILLAFADADWTNPGPGLAMMNPAALFSRLPEKTGWTQPKDFKMFAVEAKKWLKAHAESYRVQRYVSE